MQSLPAEAQKHALQLQLKPIATGHTNLDNTKFCSRIDSWLAAIDVSKPLHIKQGSVSCLHKNTSSKKCRRPLDEMDTNTNMASPPKKLRKGGGKAPKSSAGVTDVIEEEEDNSKTPTKSRLRQSTRQRLPERKMMMVNPPLFMPPSSISSQSTTSQFLSESGASSVVSISSSRARSTSPVKKKMDLQFCSHRIEYKAEPPRRKELPQDIQTLWADLQQITQTAMGVLPEELKDTPAFNNDNEDNEYGLESFNFAPSSIEADISSITHEYLIVKKLLKHTSACKTREKHEPAWNEEVHRPVLDLALGTHFQDKLAVENVTKASIDPAFMPTFRNASGSSTPALLTTYVQSKMVDYSIHWIPNPNSFTANTINRFLSTPRHGTNQPETTINQSTYTAVRDRPAAVAIETKVPGSGGGGGGRDPYVQLGIWNIAWLKRVRSILALDTNNVRTQERVVTLPMIRVDGSDWKLSFLCDSSTITSVFPTARIHEARQEIGDNEGSSILYDFPHAIGSTNSILDCYKLLASLRRIGEWVAQVYAPWWEAVVGKAIVGGLGE